MRFRRILTATLGGLSFDNVRASPAAACGDMRALTVLEVPCLQRVEGRPRHIQRSIMPGPGPRFHPRACAPGHTPGWRADEAPARDRAAGHGLNRRRCDRPAPRGCAPARSEEHTSELQSRG